MLTGRRWLACGLWATALALVLATAGVMLSREYYAVAPYHHDSAAARMYAVKLSETRRTAGLGAALREALATRDSLEPTVRLVIAPGSLRRLRGHLVIAVPLLVLFLTLVAGLVWERSGSPVLALAATLLLACFPYVYDPVAGLSDYWRESSATWLLGSAAACWLMSDGLRRRGWGTACGMLLAALVLTRQVGGVYGFAVMAPLVASVLPRAFGRSSDPVVRGRLVRLVLAAASGLVLVVLLAGERLYVYYFVTAWDYGSRADVVRFLAAIAPSRLGLGALALGAAMGAALIATRGDHRKWRWIEVGWLAASVPLLVVLSGALYHAAFALATPLLVVAGATALAAARGMRPAVALGLVVVTVAGSVAQIAVVRRQAQVAAAYWSTTRQFYQDLTVAVLGRDPSARYGQVFDAFDTIFINTAFFDRGIWPTGSVSYHTVVDSYYRNHFQGLSARDAAGRNLDALGARAGTLAAAFCTPADVAKSLPTQPFAREAASVASTALRDDARWKALRRFDAPMGCVLLYERVDRDLALDEKWAAVPDHGVGRPR